MPGPDRDPGRGPLDAAGELVHPLQLDLDRDPALLEPHQGPTVKRTMRARLSLKDLKPRFEGLATGLFGAASELPTLRGP
jgi:hypothetical protein